MLSEREFWNQGRDGRRTPRAPRHCRRKRPRSCGSRWECRQVTRRRNVIPSRTHALRGAVKVFLRFFRPPSHDCGAGMTHGC